MSSEWETDDFEETHRVEREFAEVKRIRAELEKEYPGAELDESLENHILAANAKKKRKGLIKKIIMFIVFHGLMYSLFVLGFNFLFRKYNLGISYGLIFGLVYFIIIFLFAPPKHILRELDSYHER
jgi:hypothetical protein